MRSRSKRGRRWWIVCIAICQLQPVFSRNGERAFLGRRPHEERATESSVERLSVSDDKRGEIAAFRE